MSCAAALLLFFSSFAAPESRLLKGYDVDRGEIGIVYHRGWQTWRGEDMADFVERKVRDVESTLGRELGRSITVVLTPGRKELHRLVEQVVERRPHDNLQGLALPARDWIFVGGEGVSGQAGRPGSAHETLLHEITHLVNHGARNSIIPRWFDEGVCMWVSGNRILPKDEAYLCGLAHVGGLFRVRQLETEFPRLHLLGTIAYQESQMMVSFLVEEHGSKILSNLLSELDAGKDFGRAYEDQTERSWADFEAQFFRWLSGRRNLLEVIASLVNVWTFIAFLGLIAIFRSVLRERKLRRKLEVEEKAAEEGDVGVVSE